MKNLRVLLSGEYVKMTIMGRRECHLIGLKNENLNSVVEEIKTYLEKQKIPEDYTINVNKDAVACCGYFPIGVTIEIKGAKKELINNLDVKMYSKIIEICEREGIEYHECKLEVVATNS